LNITHVYTNSKLYEERKETDVMVG